MAATLGHGWHYASNKLSWQLALFQYHFTRKAHSINHWNGNIANLTKFLSLAASKTATFGWTSDKNFLKMTTFSFQLYRHCGENISSRTKYDVDICIWFLRSLVCEMVTFHYYYLLSVFILYVQNVQWYIHRVGCCCAMFRFGSIICSKGFSMIYLFTWWRHQMETFSALLAICAGNSQVTGEFPAQRPVTRSFDIFFHLCLNKRLSKQSGGWWFETLVMDSLPVLLRVAFTFVGPILWSFDCCQ